jgi:cytochrome P450
MRRPPGPKPDSILGNLPLASDDPLGLFSSWAAQYGDIFHYRALWLHAYFLTNPDYIDYLLVRNPRNFTKDRAVRNLRWLLGYGLLTSEGEHWKRQRRLIQPAFHRDRIAGYADVMTGCTRDMLAHWRDGDALDIHREMMQVTLRIVVRCLFGVETNETAAISHSLDLLMKRNTGMRLLTPGWLRRLPLPGTSEARRAVADLNRTVAKIIASRRAAGVEGTDLLGLLMAARDEDAGAMDDRQIRDEAMTFFLAGHETTALTLTWTFYLLSRNPEAAAKLREELDRVLAGRVPVMADLPALVWTESVVKESMRLYPPAWATGRIAAADFELGGYTIPKGSMVIVSPWVMQRQERFFPLAEEFRPERWTNGETQGLPRFAYFPFGGGPRQCIGNNFAMMEAMLVLATIAQTFDVRVDLSKPVVPVTGITLRPRDGMAARMCRRRFRLR